MEHVTIIIKNENGSTVTYDFPKTRKFGIEFKREEPDYYSLSTHEIHDLKLLKVLASLDPVADEETGHYGTVTKSI